MNCFSTKVLSIEDLRDLPYKLALLFRMQTGLILQGGTFRDLALISCIHWV